MKSLNCAGSFKVIDLSITADRTVFGGSGFGVGEENLIANDMTHRLEDSLQGRITVAIEAVRTARLQIARSRAQKIQTYLLRMELRACRDRLHAEIAKAKLLALPPAA